VAVSTCGQANTNDVINKTAETGIHFFIASLSRAGTYRLVGSASWLGTEGGQTAMASVKTLFCPLFGLVFGNIRVQFQISGRADTLFTG
jgi:hypothetical protein